MLPILIVKNPLMGSMITKDQKMRFANMKYIENDVLRPPHATMTSCMEDKKILNGMTTESNKHIY